MRNYRFSIDNTHGLGRRPATNEKIRIFPFELYIIKMIKNTKIIRPIDENHYRRSFLRYRASLKIIFRRVVTPDVVRSRGVSFGPKRKYIIIFILYLLPIQQYNIIYIFLLSSDFSRPIRIRRCYITRR